MSQNWVAGHIYTQGELNINGLFNVTPMNPRNFFICREIPLISTKFLIKNRNLHIFLARRSMIQIFQTTLGCRWVRPLKSVTAQTNGACHLTQNSIEFTHRYVIKIVFIKTDHKWSGSASLLPAEYISFSMLPILQFRKVRVSSYNTKEK